MTINEITSIIKKLKANNPDIYPDNDIGISNFFITVSKTTLSMYMKLSLGMYSQETTGKKMMVI